MEITRELLVAELAEARRQQEEHLVLAQRAAGAVIVFEALLRHMDTPAEKPKRTRKPKPAPRRPAASEAAAGGEKGPSPD